MSQHLSPRRASSSSSSSPAAPTSRGFNVGTRTCESVVMLLWVVTVLLSAPVVHAEPGSGVAGLNSTVSPPDQQPSHNSTDAAAGSRVSTILRDLPTIKSVSIFVCVLTTLLITCLLVKIYSSARKIRKTRKYDIITTPAERVEMAPLNEDDDDDDDSTLFDVKYR